MSLDFFYDAAELMAASGHPFVIICTPLGTEEDQICCSENIYKDKDTAGKTLNAMGDITERLFEVYGEGELFEEMDDEEED